MCLLMLHSLNDQGNKWVRNKNCYWNLYYSKAAKIHKYLSWRVTSQSFLKIQQAIKNWKDTFANLHDKLTWFNMNLFFHFRIISFSGLPTGWECDQLTSYLFHVMPTFPQTHTHKQNKQTLETWKWSAFIIIIYKLWIQSVYLIRNVV